MKLRTKCLKLEGSWSRQPLLRFPPRNRENRFQPILFAPLLTFPSHRSTSLRFLHPPFYITPFAHPIRVQHNSNCSWKLFFFDIYIYRWKFFFFFRGKRRMRFFSITIKLISWKDRWWILEGINENDNSKGANDAFNIELVVPVGHCLSIVSRPSLPLYRSPPRIIEIF